MQQLNIVEKVIALEAVDVFVNLTPEQLARIAAIAHEVESTPGAVILDGSKPIDALYVIMEGAVELSHGDEPPTTGREGKVLGAWALFTENDPIRVTARALEDTRLLRIDREQFYELLTDHSEITSAIFAALVERFRGAVKQ